MKIIIKNQIFVKILYLLLFSILTVQTFAKSDTLTVITEYRPPFNYTDDKGNIVGLSTTILKQILDKSGVHYKIKVFPWKRAYQLAQTHPNILIYTIYRSEKREKLFKKWIGPIGPTSSMHLYKLSSNNNINIKTFNDVKNYSVGVVINSRAHELAKNRNFSHIFQTKSEKVNLLNFVSEAVDLVISTEPKLKFMLGKLNIDPKSVTKLLPLYEDKISKVYSAFSYGTDQKIIDKIYQANKELQENDIVGKIYTDFLKK